MRRRRRSPAPTATPPRPWRARRGAFEADYAVPFLAHATMEPQTCTAHVKPDGVEVWAPSQDAMTTLITAAVAAGVSNDKVTVHPMMLGGGFGRRNAVQEFVREAVLIAKEVAQPVKMVWSREEDIAHDLYRPCGMARLVGGLDADGMPIALTIRLTGPSFVASLVPAFGPDIIDRSFVSGLNDEMPYNLPNYLLDVVLRTTAVPLGAWRGINYTQNAFYRESFIDEMAHAAGADPYQFRRRLLRDSPKNLAVLDAAAQKANWGAPPPPGVFRGIAVNAACDSYCAQVVELSVERRPHPRASRHRGDRLRLCGQSAVDRDADPRRHRLRADGGAARRNHHQGRRRRAIELQHLRDAAHGRGAGSGERDRAERRFLGRRRRAAGAAAGAGFVQRDLRRHRQAHPLAAGEEPRSALDLKRAPTAPSYY